MLILCNPPPHHFFVRSATLCASFMQWFYPLQDIYEANIRAERAEKNGSWHVVVQQRLYCLERSQKAQDHLAIRFFAQKLSAAYLAMKMFEKALFYKQLALA